MRPELVLTRSLLYTYSRASAKFLARSRGKSICLNRIKNLKPPVQNFFRQCFARANFHSRFCGQWKKTHIHKHALFRHANTVRRFFFGTCFLTPDRVAPLWHCTTLPWNPPTKPIQCHRTHRKISFFHISSVPKRKEEDKYGLAYLNGNFSFIFENKFQGYAMMMMPWPLPTWAECQVCNNLLRKYWELKEGHCSNILTPLLLMQG